MNLHGIVSSAIGAVNPPVTLSIEVSTGTTQDAAFKQVPTYAAPVSVPGQVQPLTWRDLRQLEGLNLQGELVKIYINGQVEGLVRPINKGGDLITVGSGPYAGLWLVSQILEGWESAGWCSAVCVRQDQ